MGVNYNPRSVSQGLVLCIDAANPKSYPRYGDTWYDLSGNDMNFTLYNSPTFSSESLVFNGVNQYARTNKTLDLTSAQAISVVSAWKVPTNTSQTIVYEHTSDWNSVNNGYGGFGVGTNTTGSVPSANLNHNQLRGNAASGYAGVNTTSPSTTVFQLYTVLHDFSQPSGEESYSYINGVFQNKSSTSVPTPFPADNTGTFGDDYFFIAARNGSIFGSLTISYLAIYNRRLSESEIFQNYVALRGRYGL